MDRVSISFHKNVLSLTKSLPPHKDFKKHFKEGMFDKPNTTGFIHVSHYLLNIYYKENLKNKLPWPVICKQTESQFRNDMKKCLTDIASEHPDINFPPILASHLLLAGGTKFILIMWKLSIVVLRMHLSQAQNCVLSNAPKSGPCQDLTMKFLKNVTRANEISISNVRKDRENFEREAKEYIDLKNREQNCLKKKILSQMETLKEIVDSAPANTSAKKRLLDINDKEIISLWFGSIKDRCQSIEKKCQSLEELDDSLTYILNIVFNITGNSQKLNSNSFDKINTEALYNLVPPDKQVLLYNLYKEDALNIKNLFSIFTLLIEKNVKIYPQENTVKELSDCCEQLQISNGQLKNAITKYQELHKQIEAFCKVILSPNNSVNQTQVALSDAPDYAKVLFMPSPSIQIHNYEVAAVVSHNDLKLTPAESYNKDLFGRHARSNKKDNLLMKKKLPCVKINFEDDILNNTNSFKSSVPQRFCVPMNKTISKVSDKYSRLFSSTRPNYNRVNNNMMSMKSANLILNTLSQDPCLSMIDSCNSSQDFLQEPLLSNPNLNSTIEPPKLEEKETTQNNQKRRSISDLVERYKSLVQKRDL